MRSNKNRKDLNLISNSSLNKLSVLIKSTAQLLVWALLNWLAIFAVLAGLAAGELTHFPPSLLLTQLVEAISSPPLV